MTTPTTNPTHAFVDTNSSLLSFAEWYAPVGTTPSRLRVKLKANDALYTYEGVPEDVYLAFKASESAGRHFGQHIKGKYAVLR